MASGWRAAAPRWAVVGVVVAVVVALPAIVGALPVADSAVPAAELRATVLAADDVRYSGYAESAGGLALPVTRQLDSVADLFSDRTEMRVWWRGPDDHRVDVVTAAGETGIHRDARGTWTWEYERATATREAATPFALPAPPDLLPSTLGRRLLSEATDEELTRIGARRIAGRDALGLRVTPAEPASAVRQVDVWVDRASGLPLQVVVLGEASEVPALDTRFLDLDLSAPDAATTAFVPPPGAAVRTAEQAGIVLEAGRRLGPVRFPGTLAGLPRRTLEGAPPGIGLYGRGVTLLAVAPVPPRLADGLRRTLAQSPAAVTDDTSIRIAAGPVGLMLVDPQDARPFLLTGTVSLDALVEAAAQLPVLVRQR
ncbi:sigma-E factor regulatory protein RseB domain-containing protein [Blastococcus sp. VKM Ac-2987]|uniref:sigma-E factor regulatory protein RseB domain-containing protein n=1 Tax=Blastococcus sp. VKM Ac-2987 TaxID=3004141 RepID=UPI0022AB966E|nr:sigma-E factor regulatory protein RseB domain-containing protein [Blastococcus sp. VKM Ac-2987]MCZ2857094.1 transcriptional regulator [Blastococcus sp. VKM Ac-2987]